VNLFGADVRKWIACKNTAFEVKDLEKLQKDWKNVSDHAARLE
jgi:hypothetical protein